MDHGNVFGLVTNIFYRRPWQLGHSDESRFIITAYCPHKRFGTSRNDAEINEVNVPLLVGKFSPAQKGRHDVFMKSYWRNACRSVSMLTWSTNSGSILAHSLSSSYLKEKIEIELVS